MQIKTDNLGGRFLDWAVSSALGYLPMLDAYSHGGVWSGWWERSPPDRQYRRLPHYSTDWSQGGPIIEREFIELRNQTCFSGGWEAWKWNDEKQAYTIVGKKGVYCPTPLIAAMRCYVASKLGDEIEVPDELLEY